MKKIIIAIDGHSACGKSTLAKGLAKALGYSYIDTGAMYRAVTLYGMRQKVNWKNPDEVQWALDQIEIHFENCDGLNTTFLNGENVENEIRQMQVSEKVSEVAAIPAVRRAMVEQQRRMGDQRGIVLDGRDIGTVVFPQAELKLFVTAEEDVRALRRQIELQQKGHQVSFDDVKQNLQERDRIDSTREDSPLKQAEDAIVLDTTNYTCDGQLSLALEYVRKVLTESAST